MLLYLCCTLCEESSIAPRTPGSDLEHRAPLLLGRGTSQVGRSQAHRKGKRDLKERGQNDGSEDRHERGFVG